MLPEGEIDYEASHKQAAKDMASVDAMLASATGDERLKLLIAKRNSAHREVDQLNKEIRAVKNHLERDPITGLTPQERFAFWPYKTPWTGRCICAWVAGSVAIWALVSWLWVW